VFPKGLERWVLALTLTLPLLAPACHGRGSSSSGSTDNARSSTAEPGAGPMFTFITWEITSLDPLRLDDPSMSFTLANVYQTLVKMNVTGDNFEPDLAQEWTLSPDGTVWTFHLRKDAKFFDGTGVTAKDVVFSLRRTKDAANAWQWLLRDVDKIEAEDDYTAVISLKQPTAPFLSYLSLIPNAILSADFFKDAPPEKIENQPMGSGPYMLAEWKKGESLTFTANPHYFRQGYPKTKRVKLVYLRDDNTRVIKLLSGEVDAIDGAPMARIAELNASGQFDTQMRPWTTIGKVSLNNKAGPTANVDFRKALAYATNREALVKVVMFGHAKPATSFLPENTLFFSKDLKGYTYDLDRAKEHMARSGVKAGTPLQILIHAGDERRTMTATALKEMWGKLGLEITIKPLDPPTVMSKLEKGDFQASPTGWTHEILDPSHLAEFELGYKAARSCFTGYESAKMNELLAAGVRERDVKKREQIYTEIQELAIEDSPLIWLYYGPLTFTLKKNVEGFTRRIDGAWILENVAIRQ
jgi:peptide/nickel transport system substrate-binding protein